ncbi:hypothetical protein NYR97_11690 [Xanthomonas hydrangeae]|uniref:Uncharacterized protein n=1 Tax=Xanthomonas hydrangeae TaxID=2775159 RepID=A0AAU0B4E9_9XANT|nr:hypothetical protein [Xanthomonas hydrangeae]WOB47954.1 hypothetical protein NYR97_11690 [Xanthomonas hydrangeae]
MFQLLLVLLVIEGVLQIAWNRPYFRWGLPVFQRRIPVTSTQLACFSLAQVENAVEPTRWPDLRFHPLSEHAYAFRETFLVFVGPVYPLVMRGHIAIDRRRREIVITGFCNWTILYIVIVILVPALAIRPGVVLMFLGLLALVYLLQRRRFGSVETAVQMLLSTNTTLRITRPRSPRS